MLWYDSRKRRNREQFESWDDLGLEEDALAIPLQAIRELQATVQGSVLLPGDPGYAAASRLANPRFQFHPDVIVMCEANSDVAACLKVIGQYGITFSVRAGGHSTAGYSGNNVMILDVSRLDGVFVDPIKKTATVQPGCTWGAFNKATEIYGLHAPGGACPDVCQGGYMQGGGYGFTARMFGMNCDQPTFIYLMLANGKIVEASPTANKDLFWALRGGTGNNFGVVLATQYPLREGDTFLGFSLCWDLTSPTGRSDAAQSLTWIQENFVRSVPDALGFQMVWVFEGPTGGPKVPYFRIMGMYDGTQGELDAVLKPLLAQPGAQLQYFTGPKVYSALNEYLLTEPYEVPEFPPNINPDPPAENKLSRCIANTLAPDEWLALIDYFIGSPNPYTTVAFEAYRGAIGARAMNFNAFDHRNIDFDCFMDVFWLKPEDEPAMESFLEGWKTLITPYWSGQVYQNYPSDGDLDFASEYWGADVYWALRMIKTKYDRANTFRFPQSIEPVTDPPAKEGDGDPLGINEPITYLPQPARLDPST